jgi:isoleucyl-tRNA synthetase
VKFKHGTRRRALEYEKDWVQRWKQDKTFEKSVNNRSADNAYVFYDGPPFITGVPHHGTLLSSIVKDAVPRYWTMKGKHVERVWGWDCHGLPAEVFTEKKLGIKDRRDIGTKISLEKYITFARDNMVQTSSLWEDTIDRIGRWVEFKGAYKTMDKEYMESVWWAFKTLHEKGKIYEGERVLMYCTRDATPLSRAEVTMDAGAYQDVTDPSVYVKFKLDGGSTLLAWTTTPWTLPANTAVAVNPALDYVEIEYMGESFIIAKDLVEKVMTDEKHKPLEYEVVKKFNGEELVGKTYEPLFENRGKNAHKVWAADYVEAEAGTGIVHLAPAYGEEDFNLAQEKGIPVVHVIDENGFYSEGEWKGENVWDINKTVAKTLHERGDVWKIDYIRHSYPHCHRCGTKLMYRAHPSWFFDVQGQKQLMLEKNSEQITWFPEHLKHGRFEKNIEQAPDWNLSRDRFWATAMPVWEGLGKSGKKHQIIVGSYAELKELSGVELKDYHRPWVDDIEFEKDGIHYKRIDKVIDGWFESGSMPFAQFHYPFENKAKFETNFPGDFIVEYIGQVRAWFYYMHVVSIGLFGESSFKNVITTGTLAGNDGRKMSKSYGNFTDPNELMDKFSADSLRFLLLSSPVLNGEDFALHDKDVGDVARKLSMVWNMYDFFTMYAEVDGWEYNGQLKDPLDELTNPLDIWIVSRLHQLAAEVEGHMDAYNIPDALSPILPFLDDASNWYVRRSRRRFWKSEDDSDKNDAYKTLHYVLVRLAYVLAPFTPFLAEELYHNLTGDKESIHLKDWLPAGRVNEVVVDEMNMVRSYVNEGLSLRAKAGLKVRQPLSSVTVPKLGEFIKFEDILIEELNVKKIQTGKEVSIDEKLTPTLRREGLMREVIRHVQSCRKKADLQVDDRIILWLETIDKELQKAVDEHINTIKHETLAEEIKDIQENRQTVKIEDKDLTISLSKV